MVFGICTGLKHLGKVAAVQRANSCTILMRLFSSFSQFPQADELLRIDYDLM